MPDTYVCQCLRNDGAHYSNHHTPAVLVLYQHPRVVHSHSSPGEHVHCCKVGGYNIDYSLQDRTQTIESLLLKDVYNLGYRVAMLPVWVHV